MKPELAEEARSTRRAHFRGERVVRSARRVARSGLKLTRSTRRADLQGERALRSVRRVIRSGLRSTRSVRRAFRQGRESVRRWERGTRSPPRGARRVERVVCKAREPTLPPPCLALDPVTRAPWELPVAPSAAEEERAVFQRRQRDRHRADLGGVAVRVDRHGSRELP